MHIIRLTAEKFMRLDSCDCTFEKGTIVIAGKNKQGKSSVMALITSLAGKKALADEPLKDGSRKGSATITFGDKEPEYVAKWVFTKKSHQLTITAANGETVAKPAEFLKGLLSRLLDPWAFTRMATGSPAERRQAYDTIKGLMKIDVTPSDIQKTLGYGADKQITTLATTHADDPLAFLAGLEESFMANRKTWKDSFAARVAKEEVLEGQVPLEHRDKELVSVTDLIAKRDGLQDELATNERLAKLVTEAEQAVGCRELDVEAAEQIVKDAEASLALALSGVETVKKTVPAAQTSLDAARKEYERRPSVNEVEEAVTAVDTEISQVEEMNDYARKAVDFKEATEKTSEAEEKVEHMEGKIETLRELRLSILDKAELPTPNITLEDGNILLNNLPFSQASSAEQLSASLDVGMALKPKLNVFVCEDASLLDEDSMAIIVEKAKECDAQVFLEVVQSKATPGVIFVEDGIAAT